MKPKKRDPDQPQRNISGKVRHVPPQPANGEEIKARWAGLSDEERATYLLAGGQLQFEVLAGFYQRLQTEPQLAPLREKLKAVFDDFEQLQTARVDFRAYLMEVMPHLAIGDNESIRTALSRARPKWKINEATPLHEIISLLEREHVGGGRAAKRKTSLPAKLLQPTFQELRNSAIALADGPGNHRWENIHGEVALRHVMAGEPLQTKLVAGPVLTWNGRPETYEALKEELRMTGAPAALFYQIVVSAVIKEPGATFALDDLIRLIGWDSIARRSTEERERCRQQLWRWLLLFNCLQVTGKRPGFYRDPRTKEKLDLLSLDPLVVITGRTVKETDAINPGEPPVEVTLRPGEWLEHFRNNRHVLPDFGNILRIAGIPAGKPSGAWAQSIGLALNQRWREMSARARVEREGPDVRPKVRYPAYFTRRALLETFRPLPEFDVIALLKGNDPQRARKYWDEAIKLLQRAGVVGDYQEVGTLPPVKRGPSSLSWREAWLDQSLDIKPLPQEQTDSADIAQNTIPQRRKRGRPCKQTDASTPGLAPRKRGRPRKQLPEPTDAPTTNTAPRKRGRPRKQTNVE